VVSSVRTASLVSNSPIRNYTQAKKLTDDVATRIRANDSSSPDGSSAAENAHADLVPSAGRLLQE
jgi:hypothetical protein